MNKFAAVVSISLGIILIVSAFEHFILQDKMIKHYREVGFADSSRWFIGCLQLVAGINLLFKRTRLIASIMFTVVMAIVTARFFVHHNTHFPKQAFILFIAGCILVSILLINQSKNAKQEKA